MKFSSSSLQAVGTALEFGGELGAEMAKYGAAEKKHFGEAYKRLTDASDWVLKLAAMRGFLVDPHPAQERVRMKKLMDEFKWMPVDPQELDAAMASTP